MARTKTKKKDRGYKLAVSGAQKVIRILLYVCLAVAVIFLGREAYTLGYQIFDGSAVDAKEGKDVAVTVTDDMSISEIGEMLKDKGLIDERVLAFRIQELLSDYHDKILPGAYILNTSQTVEEMLAILAQENTEGQPTSLNSKDSDSGSGSASGQTSDGSAGSGGTAGEGGAKP